jgi:HNH endonuclease
LRERKQDLVLRGKNAGYLMVQVRASETNKVSTVPAHRLIALAFHGPAYGRVTRHLNGIKTDNRSTNLAWGTPKENAQDRLRHGATPIGERSHNAKLTVDEVRAIRTAEGPHRDLAGRYGVSKRTIWNIKRGRTWRHV